MKISLAQIQPEAGNFDRNLKKHLYFIRRAAENEASLIAFPELSLTGYEPGLARQSATSPDDIRFQPIQQICDDRTIWVCAGMPIKSMDAIQIGMIIFQPRFSRKCLHQALSPPG